jgi:orotate phosphoribosyltransferase
MKEIQECQCPQAGYCEFFRQEMTYNPPNWQWCQGASKSERDEYKLSCDRKHARKNFENTEVFFITYKAMIDDCINLLIPKISKMQISGIVGVPRSGMLVSSICATSLNLPLYTLSQGKIVPCNSISEFGGGRMSGHVPNSGKLLVLDDTVFGGGTLEKTKTSIGNDYYYGALYAKPDLIEKVDIFGKELEKPHLLEWHFFNSSHVKKTLFDLDGVFSPNVPMSCFADNDKYEEYLSNVEPFYHRLPKTHKLKAIVTGRLDKFRKITEEWLEKYNIEYEDLIMFPTEKEKQRDANHVQEVGQYKADVYKKSNAEFFMESEKSEGVVIRDVSKRLVILPNQGLVFGAVDLVNPIRFGDKLPPQESKIAICTIPANDGAMQQLDITRKNILNYAERCGADYIELQGDKCPEWPMYNKYRLKQVIEKYEHTLYLDCDVVVKETAPDVFKTFNKNKICAVNEWKLIEDTYSNLFKGLKRERRLAILEYPHLSNNNRNIQPNGGMMFFPKRLAERYSQPSKPYAKRWCFDQDYLLLNLEDDEFELVDWRYNLEFIDYDFWSKIEDAHFVHLNGSKPLEYRLELLHRIINKNYTFLPQPKPKEGDTVIEKFRANWRITC